ncbi:MAG: ribose-5-phosphate isomerase RpiA [Planctomycetota bacterium]
MKDPKQVAGMAAAELVRDGMTVGLGTGSTVYFTLVALARRIREEGLQIQGVPTSIDTENKARDMGIPLIGLDRVERIDVTIDGADEADPQFRLTKGGGGALLREKVVAYLSNHVAIVMTPGKLVSRLGKSFALPVEVVPFATPVITRLMGRLGARAVLRSQIDGKPYLTDNQNQILDCHFPDGIVDPVALEKQLATVPGIVETGLFIELAHQLYLGKPDGSCEVLSR